ncbi:MAG: hypothetical protein IJW06_01355 [Clostridia bacterium]|nr:hypothetical protein [Clostridia bacterium]
MAYIPNTYVPITEGKKKRVRYTLPTGGVKLSQKNVAADVGKCAQITNMDIAFDRIMTRRLKENFDERYFVSGNLNGFCNEPFYDKLIFHVGTCIYCFNPSDDELTLISDTLPDCKSLICLFMSKVYIYCNTHVYSIDSDFVFNEEQDVFAPLIYEGIVPGFAHNAKKNGTPFNLVAPRIAIEYVSSTANYYGLPHSLDTARKVEVYKDGVLLEESKYVISQDTIEIKDSLAYDNNRVIKIVYYLLNPSEAGFDGFIGNCNLVTAFGGNVNGGTRLFFTGNADKKGYYYKSELQDPLNVVEGEYEIIGDGCENVTALKKMYGDLIVFTENSVYRMNYNFTQDSTYFTVKELSCEAGCDCPGSVRLIDNRVVFANSKRGIFIIDSTEETGEQNIKPISGNILKGKGYGLLDNPKEELLSACSADFDRKYMLFVGGRVYVWDYDKTPFRDSGSYSAAQERLCWYIYDGIDGNFFTQIDARLISLYEDGGVYVSVLSDDSERTEIVSAFDSGISECFSPLTRKHVTRMSIKLSREENCSISLSLYGDGEKYYVANLPQRKSEKEKLIINLPKKALYGFGFCINGKGGYEIEEIVAEYIEITE